MKEQRLQFHVSSAKRDLDFHKFRVGTLVILPGRFLSRYNAVEAYG